MKKQKVNSARSHFQTASKRHLNLNKEMREYFCEPSQTPSKKRKKKNKKSKKVNK